jgi:hypothetical protein
MENVGMFYANWEYLTAIWYILWPFGNLVYFPPFWYIVSRKIWQPCSHEGAAAAAAAVDSGVNISKRCDKFSPPFRETGSRQVGIRAEFQWQTGGRCYGHYFVLIANQFSAKK